MKRIRCVTDAMDVEQRQCGCSGQRACLVCAPGSCKEPNVAERIFLQCCNCGKVGTSEHFVQTEEECCAFLSRCKTPCAAVPVLGASVGNACKECGEFSGVCLYKDFVTNAAEKQILENMEKSPWAMSQSGRTKQVHTVCVCIIMCACVSVCLCVFVCDDVTLSSSHFSSYRTSDQKQTLRRGRSSWELSMVYQHTLKTWCISFVPLYKSLLALYQLSCATWTTTVHVGLR